TGMNELGFFEEFIIKLQNKSSVKKINKFIVESFEKVTSKNILKNYKSHFSMVISTPVYTQLFITQVNVILQSFIQAQFYSMEQVNEIQVKLMELLPRILTNYNDLLLSVAKQDAIICIWSDMIESQPNSELLERVKTQQGCKKEKVATIEEFLSKMEMGLARYGREDLWEKTKEMYSDWWIWPFQKNRYFLVYGYIGRKK
ncbi:MAG: hypothetical protein MUO60_06335, partial [Clostridiaceae bacterium]|nr:hypothetical protein [Clostridiaceae bacterium]